VRGSFDGADAKLHSGPTGCGPWTGFKGIALDDNIRRGPGLVDAGVVFNDNAGHARPEQHISLDRYTVDSVDPDPASAIRIHDGIVFDRRAPAPIRRIAVHPK